MEEDKLYNKLSQIDSKVDTLLLWKAEHQKDHNMISRDIAESREILIGNPGLLTKVNNLWELKVNSSKWVEFWRIVLATIVSAGIIGTLMILMRYANV